MPLYCLMKQLYRVHSSRRISSETDGKRCSNGIVTAPAGTRFLLFKFPNVKSDRSGHIIKSQDGRHLNDKTGSYAAKQTVVDINVRRGLAEPVGRTDPVITDVDDLYKTPAAGGSKTWNRTSTYARSKSNMFKTGDARTMRLQYIHRFLNVNIIQLQVISII